MDADMKPDQCKDGGTLHWGIGLITTVHRPAPTAATWRVRSVNHTVVASRFKNSALAVMSARAWMLCAKPTVHGEGRDLYGSGLDAKVFFERVRGSGKLIAEIGRAHV